MSDAITPPPELPEPVSAEALRELDETGLETLAGEIAALERTTIAAMAPYDRALRELRARSAQLATERRRRERAARSEQRAQVRERARSGEMPSLADALTAEPPLLPDDRPLAEVRAYLATGGDVRFGYATRPGPLAFSDGRQIRNATTWGEARRLWADGWEPGTPGNPGARVHLAGTRVERVMSPDDVVVEGGGD